MKPNAPNNPRRPTKEFAMPNFLVRVLKASEVEFEVTVEVEDLAIEGNVLACGDAEEDRKQEQWTIDQLNHGNDYAWCVARVVARWDGFEGFDCLGGISCTGEAEFERTFLPELKENALADLNANLAAAAKKIASLL